MPKATSPPSPTYKTQQFASLTGVSVRALHHYDRLGLLKPRRSSAGYRIYTTRTCRCSWWRNEGCGEESFKLCQSVRAIAAVILPPAMQPSG
jgi:hypothetical protein